MKNLYEEEKAWAADMTQTDGKLKKVEKPAKYEQIITVMINEKYHGLELSFRFKPNATERAKLKRAGYKWHYKKMVWYATNTPEHIAVIYTLAGTKKYPDGWNSQEDTNTVTRDEQRERIQNVLALKPYIEKYPINDPRVLEKIGMSWEEFLKHDLEHEDNLYMEAIAEIAKEDGAA